MWKISHFVRVALLSKKGRCILSWGLYEVSYSAHFFMRSEWRQHEMNLNLSHTHQRPQAYVKSWPYFWPWFFEQWSRSAFAMKALHFLLHAEIGISKGEKPGKQGCKLPLEQTRAQWWRPLKANKGCCPQSSYRIFKWKRLPRSEEFQFLPDYKKVIFSLAPQKNRVPGLEELQGMHKKGQTLSGLRAAFSK